MLRTPEKAKTLANTNTSNYIEKKSSSNKFYLTNLKIILKVKWTT